MTSSLHLDHLGFSYGDTPILHEVELELHPGELIGLVGPNGAGKSTLLRCAVGLLDASKGTIRIQGAAIQTLPRREIARRIAFVPQGYEAEFAFSVRDMVAMGRVPYLGRFQPEGEVDRKTIKEALEATELLDLAHRSFAELSGGERQRVMIARAFAQEAPILVLDEPNANLDPRHAFDIMSLVRERVNRGHSGLTALHDLSLAARFCDRIAMVEKGQIKAIGIPTDVLTPDVLRSVFEIEAELFVGRNGTLHIGVYGSESSRPEPQFQTKKEKP